jgi:hypothetical protein
MVLALLGTLCGLTMMGKYAGKCFDEKGKCPFSSQIALTK